MANDPKTTETPGARTLPVTRRSAEIDAYLERLRSTAPGRLILARVFKQLAQLSGGAHLGFDLAGIAILKTLLGAIAVFATGGRMALENYAATQGGAVLQLIRQLGR